MKFAALKKRLPLILIAVLFLVIIIFIIAVRSSPEKNLEFDVHFPQSEEELINVPDEYKNNVYLAYKGEGACDKLLGDVHVTLIFVSDSQSKWTDAEKKAFEVLAVSTFKRMESDASYYGKELNIGYDIRSAEVNFNFNYADDRNWADGVLASLDMSTYSYANLSLEEEYNVDEAPIVFVLNYEGRCVTSNSENTEFAVIFDDSPALYHEICHLFGARDYYFPDETETYSLEIFGDSIMDNAYTGEIDDLTAFIMGWRDDLSDKALVFLEKTNHITEQNINEAKETA